MKYLFRILSAASFVIFLQTPRFLASIILIIVVTFCVLALIKEPHKWIPGIILTLAMALFFIPDDLMSKTTVKDANPSINNDNYDKVQAAKDREYYRDKNVTIDYSVENNYDYLTVKGRLTNNGPYEIFDISLLVKIFDKAGNVVNTETSYIYDKVLVKTSKDFTISLGQKKKDYDGYAVTIEKIDY